MEESGGKVQRRARVKDSRRAQPPGSGREAEIWQEEGRARAQTGPGQSCSEGLASIWELRHVTRKRA